MQKISKYSRVVAITLCTFEKGRMRSFCTAWIDVTAEVQADNACFMLFFYFLFMKLSYLVVGEQSNIDVYVSAKVEDRNGAIDTETSRDNGRNGSNNVAKTNQVFPQHTGKRIFFSERRSKRSAPWKGNVCVEHNACF